MGQVRDVETMCWKQDLTQMLGEWEGGKEGERVGGREGSRGLGGQDVHSVGTSVLFFICLVSVWFVFFFFYF